MQIIIEVPQQAEDVVVRVFPESPAPGIEAGATEYDSWSPGLAEYDSWTRPSVRGARAVD